ncbi:MAG: hypothetical protein ABJM43_04230 [Paracoccaceae bacterium]
MIKPIQQAERPFCIPQFCVKEVIGAANDGYETSAVSCSFGLIQMTLPPPALIVFLRRLKPLSRRTLQQACPKAVIGAAAANCSFVPHC